MKTTEIIIQFIPIIIIFVLLKFSKQFVSFSFTILGKFIAIMIIIFYSSIDLIVGLFVCCLVILYYQSDYLENMLNLDDSINMNDISEFEAPEKLEFNYDVDGIPDDEMYLVPMAEDAKVNNKKKIQKKRENMENYSIYDDNNFNPNKDLISNFKKKNCINNKLKYKDMTVKNDMAENVFSELTFKNGLPCNPCSITCKYSIIEEKMKTEEKMKPISTTQ
jgi:energy-coupling factor transporter transmembrane protein EcfT